MGAAGEVERATRRVEELVFALEALPDPAAATAARELVALVLQLHGKALARMMDTLAGDPAGPRLAAVLADDDDVGGVLLLHDLHPADIATRVRRVADRLRPHLGVQGIAVQHVGVDEDRVTVRLGLGDAGRYQSADADAIRREVRQALADAAPDASAIEVDGLPSGTVFVPLSSITVRRKVADTAGTPG